MILSGPEIQRQVEQGNIVIDPFDAGCLGRNSYDVHLGKHLKHLERGLVPWDLSQPIPPTRVRDLEIPEGGMVLNHLAPYLGHIIERVLCHSYVPWIDGRSTVGRYFLQVHMTAGRGDDGWEGIFTLEMMALAQPVRVYAGQAIAQLTFFKLLGDRGGRISRYHGQIGPTPPKPLPLPNTASESKKGV